MIDDVLRTQGVTLPTWLVAVLFLGVLVDCSQAIWLFKRSWKRFRRTHENALERKILARWVREGRMELKGPETGKEEG